MPAPGIRWWPPVVVAIVAATAITVLQFAGEGDRQRANMQSAGVFVIASLLVTLWFFGFSRADGKTKLLGLGALGVASAVLFACVRIRGVTGDLVPIFEWRWSAAEAPEAVAAPRVKPQRALVPGLVDSPQFFGPERTGKLPGPTLARDWQQHPPVELWRRPVGAAWSGFSVVGRHAITQEQHDEREMVVCYDVLEGSVRWTHTDETRYETTLAGVGPRATPTIDGEFVYALGATGLLNCLEAATGTMVWSKNILADNGAPLPEWGVAGSPLIHGDLVVVCAGGPNDRSLVAYDKRSGERVWGGGSEPAHWSSPTLARLASTEQILIFHGTGVTAHDPANGRCLWSHPWNPRHPHVCLPVAISDRVLISSGYGEGAELIEITRDGGDAFAVERVWRSRAMKAKFTNVLVHDGCIYGLDDGILACVDLATGRRNWKGGRYGHGQILLVSDLLLVMTERGEVVLVEPDATELRELTRFEAFTEKTWNPPTLAGEYLLVRNDLEAACYRLPVE